PYQMHNFFLCFSSRRRHTRFSRDWCSDVCSSDLRPPRRVLPHPRLLVDTTSYVVLHSNHFIHSTTEEVLMRGTPYPQPRPRRPRLPAAPRPLPRPRPVLRPRGNR